MDAQAGKKTLLARFTQDVFKKKRTWLILSLLLLVAAVGAYTLVSRKAAAEAASASEAEMQTAVARLGEIVVSASGTGQVIPASEVELSFDESGVLTEMNVGVGQQVKVGDVLARMQSNEDADTLAAELSEAELAVAQAQKSLDDLYVNADATRTAAMNNVATYSQAVRDAQYQLEFYSEPAYLRGLDTMEAVDKMKAELDAARIAFDPFKYLSEYNQAREDALEELNEAQARYDAAVKRLNYHYTLQVAQANLDSARQEYERYQDGPPTSDVAVAEAELVNAQARLKLAQQALQSIDLVAPMDGVVMDITADVGDSVSNSAVITLADLQRPSLEVYIDETDLDKVAVGYPVEVTFDALPDEVITGTVTAVYPGLQAISNVNAIKVLVQLNPGENSASLPVGLNASVEIIAGKAKEAILVPIEALRDLGGGEFAVFVVENSEPVLRVVTVGLRDITYAQILSGVQAGDVVTTGIVASQ